MMGFWLRQSEQNCGHLWQRYSVTLKKSWCDHKTFELTIFASVASLLAATERHTLYICICCWNVVILTRRVPQLEQELLTLPEYLRSPPVFSGVRVTRSLVLYVCFLDRCLSFCSFSFVHCVVCSSSIYGFWLPL